MTDTNINRVKDALDELHRAVCEMDKTQITLFKNTSLGRHVTASVALYGNTQASLRSDF